MYSDDDGWINNKLSIFRLIFVLKLKSTTVNAICRKIFNCSLRMSKIHVFVSFKYKYQETANWAAFLLWAPWSYFRSKTKNSPIINLYQLLLLKRMVQINNLNDFCSNQNTTPTFQLPATIHYLLVVADSACHEFLRQWEYINWYMSYRTGKHAEIFADAINDCAMPLQSTIYKQRHLVLWPAANYKASYRWMDIGSAYSDAICMC